MTTDISSEPELSTPPPFRVDLVSIFPRMFEPFVREGVLARGIKSGLIAVHVWDLRDFSTDRHRSTDDEAYGGGGGMVMLAEPVFRCVDQIRSGSIPASNESPSVPQSPLRETPPAGRAPYIVLMSPQGRLLNQSHVQRLRETNWLVILCGRYEGFDERIRRVVDEEISVGDFVVSGGELPAMLMVDAVSRMVEGVVGSQDSVKNDSFFAGLLDYPHYTRPAELRGDGVPPVLISGHAENIRKWRREQALRATLEKRPDLLEGASLDAEGQRMLDAIRREKKTD